MANLRRSIPSLPMPSLQGLSAEPPPRPRPRPRAMRLWLVIAGAIAVVLATAWFEGGERALRPIAEDVALPEQQP